MDRSFTDRFIASVWRLSDAGPELTRKLGKTSTRPIFDLGNWEPNEGPLAEAGVREVYLSVDRFMDDGLVDLLERTGVETLWIECHPAYENAGPDRWLERARRLGPRFNCIPVSGDPAFLTRVTLDDQPPDTVALKGSEAAGLVGGESASILLTTLMHEHEGRLHRPNWIVWGGIATPEAATAFLATGARGIVLESLHWLTDSTVMNERTRRRFVQLRPEHMTLVGENLGTPLRFFDKGNSRAVKKLRNEETALTLDVRKILQGSVHPLDSELGLDEIVPLGPEAAFATSFINRFGRSTVRALDGFRAEVSRQLETAGKKASHFVGSPVARELGTTYPFIQGAMAWVSDVPEFSLAVARAGGLPIMAMGMRSRHQLDDDLRRLKEVMGGRPFALNCMALPENPHLEEQLEWLEDVRPPFVVIGAGDPSHVSRLLGKGLEVIYIASDEGPLRLALKAGVRFVVLEGREAGGHVGAHSTMTLAQIALELRRREPDLFTGCRLALAGGIFDRRSAMLAALLGADALQMGTAYLATEEIVSTGALTKLYQRMVREARPGATVVTGGSVGLSVRSLKTPIIDSITGAERDFSGSDGDEAAFRRRMEELAAGSLHIAAKGVRLQGGAALDEATCLEKGQFMCGAAAGAIDRIRTVEELHRELAQGGLDSIDGKTRRNEAMPETSSSNETYHRAQGESVAVTGLAQVNALGNNPHDVWKASLALDNGVTTVPASRWNHDAYFAPYPSPSGKTYCRAGAFIDIALSRKQMDLAPQDFRTMSKSTRLTLHLAGQAVLDSGILDSAIPRERIGVFIAQNSGECASSVKDLIIESEAVRIVESVGKVIPLSPSEARAAEEQIKVGRQPIDDTTLVGRLNNTAGGFICNKFGFRGPSFAVTAACAGSLAALYSAVQMIASGVIDAAVVGGGEEALTPRLVCRVHRTRCSGRHHGNHTPGGGNVPPLRYPSRRYGSRRRRRRRRRRARVAGQEAGRSPSRIHYRCRSEQQRPGHGRVPCRNSGNRHSRILRARRLRTGNGQLMSATPHPPNRETSKRWGHSRASFLEDREPCWRPSSRKSVIRSAPRA